MKGAVLCALCVASFGSLNSYASVSSVSSNRAIEDIGDVSDASNSKSDVIQKEETAGDIESESGVMDLVAESRSESAHGRDYGFSLSLSHSFGAGTFLAGQEFDYARYISQTWTLGGNYALSIAGHRLALALRWSFDLVLTIPNTNPARHFDPYDLQLSVSDPKLWTIPLLEADVSAGLTFFLPISYASRQVTQRWLAMRLALGVNRRLGALNVSYGLSLRRSFNGSMVTVQTRSLGRGSDPVPTGQGSIAFGSGYANTEWELQNSFAFDFSFLERWSLSYSIGLLHIFKYTIHPEVDQYTSIHAQAGFQNSADVWSSGLELGYGFGKDLERIWNVPLNASLALGVASFHPAMENDNRNFIPPVIFNAFWSDKAANNYGSVYFRVAGSY